MLSWDFLKQGPYIAGLLSGLKLTLLLTIVTAVGSSIGGSVIAALRVLGTPHVRKLGEAYVELVRNIPPIVQIFFWYAGMPVLFNPVQYPSLYGRSYEFRTAALAFSLYGAAFVGEAIRGGIEAVPKGQWEAAQATGLTRIGTLRHVILPQAVQIVLPALGNEFMGLLKLTAIAMTIAVPELTWQAQKIEADLFRGFEAITIVTGAYLVLCLISGLLARWCEIALVRRWGISHRRIS